MMTVDNAPWDHRVRVFAAAAGVFITLGTLAGGRAAEAKKEPVPIKLRELDATAAAAVSYARQIRPMIADNCSECHSAEDHKSGLDASSVAGLLKGGKKAGPAIVPGKPDESALIQYIRGLREPQMPKGNLALSEADLHLLRLWILAGAKDDSEAVAAAPVSRQTAGSSGTRTSNGVAGIAAVASGDSSGSQEALNAVLFSANNEERFFLQRAIRLAQLPKAAEPPKVQAPCFNPIDQFIAASWEQAKLPQASAAPAVCSDAAFLRRVYLDVIGVIPTAAQAKEFLDDRSPDKRVRLVDTLLERKEDYAAHWTPFWEEAIGSANVDVVGGIASRGNHREWLFKSFIENKPYDLMVAELLDPTLPGYRKPIVTAANGKRIVAAYIRNETHVETIQSAANVAQVFLGTSMKCASCHNHFLNKEWPQSRFLAFAGMFASNDLEQIRCEKPSGQFVPARFPFDLPGAPETTPAALEDRLHRVAQLLVDPANPRFAKSIVNRLWRRYLGLGLFEPQDDFRLDQPPSQPELLEWLADDFMRHGYDLKHTIRSILTSRTYQLRYEPELEDHFDVNKPQQARYYRSPSLRRLTAEELLDSINLALTQKLEGQRRLYVDKASTALSRALGRPASHNEISTARPDDVAVVQALELLNGEEFYERIYGAADSPGVLTRTVFADEKELVQAIDRLYWAALSRPASAEEQKLGAGFLKTNLPGTPAVNTEPVEEVWLDDAMPEGSHADGTGGADAWKWVTKSEGPVFSGERAHTQGGMGKQLQHSVVGGGQPLRVGPDDVLFTYAYLDPQHPPREIMLQWNNGNWSQRAFWGDDLIMYGEANTASRRRLGPLPKTGEWVRLEVPAREVGISTATDIAGWSFDQQGGKVYWDKSGVVKLPRNPNREPMGDVLWALFVSPEFQYIH